MANKQARMSDITIGNEFTLLDESINRYFNDIKYYMKQYISDNEEVELFMEYKRTKSESIKHRIVKANLRFVVSIAKMCYIKNNTLSVIDYIQWGNIGLIDAIDLFDVTRGFKFISYAVFHIRKELYKNMNEFRRVRIPSNIITIESKINRFNEKHLQQNEFLLSMHDIADQFTEDGLISGRGFIHGLMAFAGNKSIDDVILEMDELEIHETIESEEDIPLTDKSDINHKWEELFSILSTKDRDMVELFYGVGGNIPKSIESIGEMYKLTNQRVSQIVTKSVNKLKEHASVKKISWSELV